MVISPAGFGPENDSAGEVQQRGRSTSPHPQVTVMSWEPDGCLTPTQTGLLTFGRNITLTLNVGNMRLGLARYKNMAIGPEGPGTRNHLAEVAGGWGKLHNKGLHNL
jgi:hypothetical protein